MAECAEFRFDPRPLGPVEIERVATEIWADIAFDYAALARLKRDGLPLDGVRLTGPCPYRFDPIGDRMIRVQVGDAGSAEPLLDLWRLHFIKGLRPGSIAA